MLQIWFPFVQLFFNLHVFHWQQSLILCSQNLTHFLKWGFFFIFLHLWIYIVERYPQHIIKEKRQVIKQHVHYDLI